MEQKIIADKIKQITQLYKTSLSKQTAYKQDRIDKGYAGIDRALRTAAIQSDNERELIKEVSDLIGAKTGSTDLYEAKLQALKLILKHGDYIINKINDNK